MITRSDALNDALERLQGHAYLDAPGFACHGPMGAETLSTLGHKNLGVLLDAFPMRRVGDHDQVVLQAPAQQHLRWCVSGTRRDPLHRLV
jgi:hypothetical protein